MHAASHGQRSLTPANNRLHWPQLAAHFGERGNEAPQGMVVFFMTPNSAICNQLQHQRNNETLHYLAELAFIVEAGLL